MAEPKTYLVVHRHDHTSAILATLVDPPRHFTAMEPFASRLRLEGKAHGELVLVEEKTRRRVARYRLERPPPPHRRTGAPPRRVPRRPPQARREEPPHPDEDV